MLALLHDFASMRNGNNNKRMYRMSRDPQFAYPVKPQPYDQPEQTAVTGGAVPAMGQITDPRILNAPPEIRDSVREGLHVLQAHEMTKVQARVCAILDISG